MNNTEYIGAISNGFASAKINASAGNYTLTIKNPSTGEQVDKKLIISKISVPNFYTSVYQQGYVVSIYADLPLDATGFVTLNCGDMDTYSPTNYTESIGNKKYTKLELSNLDVGEHRLAAFYGGDDNYNSAHFEYTFIVTEADIHINASDAEYYYCPNYVYSVSVDNHGKPVSGLVSITVDSWTYMVPYDSATKDHNAELHIKKPGVYPVVIEYGGRSVTRTITVLPTVVVNTLNYEYPVAHINITLLDNAGNPLKNKDVEFFIDDDRYTGKTDANGNLCRDIELDVNYYYLTVNNDVTKENFYERINVNKMNPDLEYKLTENIDSYTFRTIMTPLVSGGSLVYTFEGKEYTIKYNGGFSDFIMRPTYAGVHNVVVKFTGDDNINQVTKTFSLDLKNKADNIYANGATVGYGQGGSVAISLAYANGNAKANSRIAVTVNGQTSYVTTNANGKATYYINLNAGTYSAKLSSDNNGYRTITITVKKSTPTLKASATKFKVKAKKKKYSATMSLPKLKLNHYKLTIKVKGKKYSAFTNANGKATFNLNKLKKKGTFKAVITFAGDKNLNKVTKKVKIKVK